MKTSNIAKLLTLWWIINLSRSTQPMRCQYGRAMRLYHTPNRLNCSSNNATDIKVELFKNNIKEYETSIKTMSIIKKTCKTTFVFRYHHEEKEERVFLDKNKATELINRKACINEKGEIVTKNIINKFNCIYSWGDSYKRSTYSCYHSTGKVYATHSNYLFSDVTSLNGCSYQDGYCRSIGGSHSLWVPRKEVKNKYIPLGTWNATKLNEHIIIPHFGLVFIINNMQKEQSYFFDQGFKLKIISKVSTTTLKENLASSTLEEKFKALESEIQGKLQYVTDLLYTPTHKIQTICTILDKSNAIITALASQNPTQYARETLKDDYLVAKLAKPFLIAYKCLPVFNYKFTLIENICYAYIPLKYKLSNTSNWEKGYLHPKLLIIYDTAVKIHCKGANIEYIYLNNSLWKYIPGELPKYIPSNNASLLPTYGIGDSDLYNLPNIWAYNPNDYRRHDAEAAAIDYIDNEIHYIQPDADIPRYNTTKINFLDSIGLFKFSFGAYIHTILTWITRVFSVLGFLAFLNRSYNQRIILSH